MLDAARRIVSLMECRCMPRHARPAASVLSNSADFARGCRNRRSPEIDALNAAEAGASFGAAMLPRARERDDSLASKSIRRSTGCGSDFRGASGDSKDMDGPIGKYFECTRFNYGKLNENNASSQSSVNYPITC